MNLSAFGSLFLAADGLAITFIVLFSVAVIVAVGLFFLGGYCISGAGYANRKGSGRIYIRKK